MKVLKIAAFSQGNMGGNPAGVQIVSKMPEAAEMQRIAHEVGFSETVFATEIPEGWRVRYFSPESEVPFCGHATIALGAALAMRQGDGVFSLTLNDARITVESRCHSDGTFYAAMQSPPTYSKPADKQLVSDALTLFNYCEADLDMKLPPAIIHGGANHLLLGLSTHEALTKMKYDLNMGKKLMHKHGLVTIMLAWAKTPQYFYARNAFASGGVYEDPATGAAAAALAGYLRDISWPHGGRIDIVQGEDMGMPSRLHAEISPERGSSILISGMARIMEV